MKILLVGAGKMAHGFVHDVVNRWPGDNCIVVIDANKESLDRLEDAFRGKNGQTTLGLQEGGASSVSLHIKEMQGIDCLVSMVPYEHNLDLAKQAIAAGAHYIDLGGNSDVVRQQMLIEDEAIVRGVCLIPDCGVAPGLASIMARHALNAVAKAQDEDERRTTVCVRVGGLPLRRDNPLQYCKTFSVHGLINEYTEPCEIVLDGSYVCVPGMSGVECERDLPDHFGDLEAFHTSGGISTTASRLCNTVANLDYKTLRYPGHCEIMSSMLDLFVRGGCREEFEAMLERVLPEGQEDVILFRVRSHNPKRSYQADMVVYAQDGLTAMARITSFMASIVANMACSGSLPHGFVHQDRIASDKILKALSVRGLSFRAGSGEHMV